MSGVDRASDEENVQAEAADTPLATDEEVADVTSASASTPPPQDDADNDRDEAQEIEIGDDATTEKSDEEADEVKDAPKDVEMGKVSSQSPLLEVQKTAPEDDEDEDSDDEEDDDGMMSKVRKFSNVECICFFLFLIVFGVMTALSRGNGDLNYTQTYAIRRIIIDTEMFPPKNEDVGEKTYQDIASLDDIWSYIEVVLVPSLLVETYPNGDFIEDPNMRYYPIEHARLLGGIRLRQSRYQSEKCSKDRKKFPQCYDLESTDDEDFDIVEDGEVIETYKFKSAEDLDDQTWRGKFGTYGGGGYVIDLPLNQSAAMAQVDTLKEHNWLDAQTRFLAIDFNLYNPSAHLHTVGRLALEMPTGGIFPNYEIKTWSFLRYDSSNGNAVAAMQVFFALFIVGFTVIMAKEMHEEGCGCKKSGYWGKTKWRILDLLNLCIFYCSIGVFISNAVTASSSDLTKIDKFKSFRRMQYIFLAEVYLLAVNSFISFIKLFKYFSVNKRLKFFFTMMRRAGQDIVMFMILLAIFFLAFGWFGYLAFSSDVDDYRSPIFSFFNMMRFVVSDLPYGTLVNSSRMWGSIYYVLWSLLIVLVLANVFIAILAEAYADVQMELKDETGLSLGLFGINKGLTAFQNMVRNLGLGFRHEDLDEDGDGQVSADEIARQLGWSVKEAQQFIDEHDTDKNGQLSIEEWRDLAAKLKADEKKQKKNKKAGVNDNLLTSYSLHGDERVILSSSVETTALSGSAGGASGISQQQFDHLLKRFKDLEALLQLTLEQTKTGSRALKQHEQKRKSMKRKAARNADTPMSTKNLGVPQQSQSSLRQ